VSLSPVEDVTKSSREEDCDYAQNELETTDDGHEQGRTSRHDEESEPQNHAEYPDEPHSYLANEANSDSPPPSPPPSETPPDTPTPRDETGTPAEQVPPQKASPTPSLHLPPVTASAVSSPQLSSNHQKHKVKRSSGPSAFEKVVNKTRPTFLPPKSRDEDQKHLAVWEKMMKRSLAAGT
jgi:TBC1 domain family member 14